jgi:hypothetical protein
MKTPSPRFLVSRNPITRQAFTKAIPGKAIVIHNGPCAYAGQVKVSVDMADLMKDDVFLPALAKMDANTPVVLMDVLVKHGVYTHPYGRIYSFTEKAAGKVYIVDSFAFKYTEKGIFRPFLFMDQNILGSSLMEFYNEGPFKDFAANTIEHYIDKVRQHITTDAKPLEVDTVKFRVTKDELMNYEKLKDRLINKEKLPKASVVNQLIAYVDALPGKVKAVAEQELGLAVGTTLLVKSNNPKSKFKMYEALRDPRIDRVVFFSSGKFGADELALAESRDALVRHNHFLALLS